MISVQDLCVEFEARPLFSGVSFVINKGDRVALVGKNGAGKTTLLNIISGCSRPTSGTVSRSTGITIGYLPQQMKVSDDTTLRDEAAKAFHQAAALDEEIDALNAQIARRDDYDSEEYQSLLERLALRTEARAEMQSEGYEAQLEKTLIGLGFERSDFTRGTCEFSGGWRMRVEIAKLLLSHPDALLLDEPTNHLDIESIQWLERFLKTYRGAVLLVSHDRAFIDNVTNRTMEISVGKIYDYRVNYSHFVELRKERIEQQRRAYENQQKMIHDTEEFIEKFRYKATKAVQVQSRIKQLAKIERIEIDEVDRSRIRLRFPPAPRSGDYPVIIHDLTKCYGELMVFKDVELTIKRGEKVAFVGKNGAGKSTLVKCIMNEIPFDGELKIGHNVKIAYFAQNQAQLLDGELTVRDTIDRVATGDMRTRIDDLLGAFMFGGAAGEKRVKVLSGGEKSRLAMMRLLLQPANLLILDEPTNHLDMQSKEILKQAIAQFDGTAIVVSHDRYFLDGLVSRVCEFRDHGVRVHLGGVSDFLESKRIDDLRELEAVAAITTGGETTKTTSDAHRAYLEKKAHDRLVRQAAKRVESLEAIIADTEQHIALIEQRLAEGDNGDAQVYEQHAQLSEKLNQTMLQWEEASQSLDELNRD